MMIHPLGRKHTNRLAGETSPYLLQHANNPVDWYPWGDEAFEKARAEDKPVFLSIGYSTCHWCHVMERESFEDEEVAALLNEHFVAIKVDREERPDVDAVYMSACQMLTGSGGWPLSLLLDPDRRPFFAATYIPKGSRLQRAGMMELLPRVAELWRARRAEITRDGEKIAEVLSAAPRRVRRDAALDAKLLDDAQRRLSRRFDPEHGGFGPAPKFPTPHNLGFLLRDFLRTGRTESRHMVVETLESMRRGGIWDHVGFGFHRYSTDRRWLVPHFEKMLYDQALLIDAYVDAFLVTGRENFARTVREIFRYLRRDLRSPEGGFYSAEDADSEGEEGKFYCWTVEEVRSLLGEEAGLVEDALSLTSEGSYREEATGLATGKNIPHLARPLEAIAASRGLDAAALDAALTKSLDRLRAARSQRVRPSLDDKVLADWNGLTIAALARAATALDAPDMLDAALDAARFVTTSTYDEAGGLLHSWRAGRASIPGFLDDHAFLLRGFMELYQATFDPLWLERAVDLADRLIERFWDDDGGGFFLSAADAEVVLARQKDAVDGALPSGNSVAATELIRLARATGRQEYEDRARAVIEAFAADVTRAPEAFTALLTALDLLLSPSREIVIVGDEDAEDTKALLAAVRRRLLPSAVVLLETGTREARDLAALAPFTAEMRRLEGRATAYVCRDHACELPITAPADLIDLLDGAQGAGVS